MSTYREIKGPELVHADIIAGPLKVPVVELYHISPSVPDEGSDDTFLIFFPIISL